MSHMQLQEIHTHLYSKYSLCSYETDPDSFHEEAATPAHSRSNSYNIIMSFSQNVNLPSQTPGRAVSPNLYAHGQILSQHLGRCQCGPCPTQALEGTGLICLVFASQWGVRTLPWTCTVRPVHKYSLS